MLRFPRRLFGWVPPALVQKAAVDLKGTNVLVLKIVSYGTYPTKIRDTTCKDSTNWVDSWVIPSDSVVAAGGSVTGAVYNLKEASKID